ncbi:hypothetical protein Pmani_031553 [Petrolisthes manimaculis]|uniref:Uncharacterized protein n=1 Tax=Petrolisthes manimaculis TaxID=1843537 RepID=A0AAE1TRV6_9EUCA|nr:hypothetical protein Pmani_031553 [Petrolisthes manimaculis]
MEPHLHQDLLPFTCLRAGVVTLPGLVQVTRLPDGDGVKVSGPLTRILSTIATSLNTCVEFVAPSDNLWGNRNPDGNWTGVLGLTHRKEVDMTGTVLTVDKERSQDFTFSVPIRSYERTIVYTRPVPEADITGFIRPYTPLVWCLLLMTLIIMWLSLWATQHYQHTLNKHQAKKGEEKDGSEEVVVVDNAIKNSAWTSTLWIITAPIAQASAWWPVGGRVRTVAGVWLLMSLVLSSVFRSNLKAMLILPRLRLPFESLEGLIQSNIPTFILQSTVFHEAILNAETGSQLNRLLPQLDIHSNIPLAIKNLMAGTHSILTAQHPIFNVIHQNFLGTRTCPFYVVPSPHKGGWYYMFFPKASRLKPLVDKTLVRLQEAGILDKIIMEDVRHARECLKPKSSAVVTSLRALELGDFYGVYSIYGGCIVAAGLAFLLEMNIPKFRPTPNLT